MPWSRSWSVGCTVTGEKTITEKSNIKMHFVVEKDHLDSEHRISDKLDKIMLWSSVPGPKKNCADA